MTLRRPLVKYVLPTAALFALYLGAFAGIWLAEASLMEPHWSVQLLAAGALAVPFAFGTLAAGAAALGAEAAHVDVLRATAWMTAAFAFVALERAVGERVGWALPQFVESLAVWGAGFWVIWRRETF